MLAVTRTLYDFSGINRRVLILATAATVSVIVAFSIIIVIIAWWAEYLPTAELTVPCLTAVDLYAIQYPQYAFRLAHHASDGHYRDST